MTRCWFHGTIGSFSIFYSAVSHAAMWAPGENRCSLPGATDDHRTFADLCTACIRADGGDQCIEEREGVSHQQRYYWGRPIPIGFVSDGRRSGLNTLMGRGPHRGNSFSKQCSAALVVTRSFTEVFRFSCFDFLNG